VIVMVAASTGNFRRFERFAIFLVFGSLLLVPVSLMVHPPVDRIATDFFVPKMPQDAKLSEVMLLIISPAWCCAAARLSISTAQFRAPRFARCCRPPKLWNGQA
jgi:hypothetical protein